MVLSSVEARRSCLLVDLHSPLDGAQLVELDAEVRQGRYLVLAVALDDPGGIPRPA